MERYKLKELKKRLISLRTQTTKYHAYNETLRMKQKAKCVQDVLLQDGRVRPVRGSG